MTRIFSLLLIFTTVSTKAVAQKSKDPVGDIMAREMQERKIPGLQIAVVKGGKIVLSRSYGTASLPDQVPVDHNTIFAVNSCTKVFTGVAIMQLVEQGKIDLNAPVAAYLPDLPEAWRPVTIKQLLTHTSGLPNLLGLLDPRTGGLGSFKEEAAIWAKLITLPLEFQRGERFSYNQTNAYLLGKMIDKLSGLPFADFFAQKQFLPLQMDHTVFGDSRDVIPHFAPTYNWSKMSDGKVLAQPTLTSNYYEFPYFRRTASGLNTTAEDMAKWVIALQQGKLLSSAARDTMWSPVHFNDGRATSWALGWGLNKFRAKHKAVGMSGGGRAAFLIYPDDDLAVIIWTNLGGSYPEDFLEEVAGCYLPDIMETDPNTFLRVNLRKLGYDKATTLATEQMKKDPQFKPNEFELNEWAYRMLAKGQVKEALGILKLEVHLFPNSWNAVDSYAEGLLKNGDKEQAITMYRRSVELNPNNEHGKKVLDELLNSAP